MAVRTARFPAVQKFFAIFFVVVFFVQPTCQNLTYRFQAQGPNTLNSLLLDVAFDTGVTKHKTESNYKPKNENTHHQVASKQLQQARIFHPVFAAATSLVRGAWEKLKYRAKMHTIVEQASISDIKSKDYPTSIHNITKLLNSQMKKVRASKGDTASKVINSISKILQDTSNQAKSSDVVYTDDRMGVLAHADDIFVSDDPGRFIAPYLHSVASEARQINNARMHFVVLYPASAVQLVDVTMQEAMKSKFVPDGGDSIDNDGRIQLWLRSVSDRVAAMSVELMTIDPSLYTCIPIGEGDFQEILGRGSDDFFTLLGRDKKLGVLATTRLVQDFVGAGQSKGQAKAPRELQGKRFAPQKLGTATAVRRGLFVDLKQNLQLFKRVCSR